MAIVRLKNINLSFGAEPIFDGAELVIETGERVCLVGRNGQGKSTLMRLLLGTLKPDEGEVWRKPDAEIAYVPQDVPEGTAGCVRDLLEQACSRTLQLVRAYETLAGQLNEHSTPDMYERLEALQTQIDEANGWDVARACRQRPKAI